MNTFSIETMATIAAVQRYIDKYQNTEAIDKYYQEHGTYAGIIEYLNKMEKETDNKEKTDF